MKLLIVGSRSITDFDLAPHIPPCTEIIISGGAVGVDRLAEKYADKNRLSKIILRPKYKTFGKFAPLKRNEQMVDMADSILVVWDGKSRGCAYTVNYAKKQGKPINIITAGPTE